MIECECKTCKPGWCAKEAILQVQRDGKTMNVCHNCQFEQDKKLYRLFVKEDIPRLAEGAKRPGVRPMDYIFQMLGGEEGSLESFLELPILH